MRGEFIGVLSEMWRGIWLPLTNDSFGENEEGIPNDVFCEIYRELVKALQLEMTIEDLANTIDNPAESREAIENLDSKDLSGERALVSSLEAVHSALEEFGGDKLSNRYFNLLGAFIDRYSLRYDLRRPCALCPNLPGVFASLVRDLRAITTLDSHLDILMKDFENAVRDLRHDTSDGRIKTCIQKQVNLLEALGRAFPGVTGTTLGKICDQVGTWPHEKLKAAMKNLYGFASDYPGIRHGGTPCSALRAVDMRDLVAMSILLMGFTPYLESRLNADAIFGGSITPAGSIPLVAPVLVPGSPTHGAPQAGGFLERLIAKSIGRLWGLGK